MIPDITSLQAKTLEAKKRIAEEERQKKIDDDAKALELAQQYEREFQSKLNASVAYIGMMMEQAANAGETSYTYSFGSKPDSRVISEISKRFSNFNQTFGHKDVRICICYDTDSWDDITTEIVTFTWLGAACGKLNTTLKLEMDGEF